MLKNTFTYLVLLWDLLVWTQAYPGPSQQHVLSSGNRGAVASNVADCSNVGMDMLKQGGNAADAVRGHPEPLLNSIHLVSVAKSDVDDCYSPCNGVIGMYHHGIGGGFLAVIQKPDRTFQYVDAREAAPALATEDMLAGNKSPLSKAETPNQPGNESLSYHRLDEAMRFGYASRARFGDPDYIPNLPDYEDFIVQPEYAENIRQKITDNQTHPIEYYNPEGLEIKNTGGTAHFTTTDSSGLSISLTSTINLLFGSQLMVPETGVIMNNEMDGWTPALCSFALSSITILYGNAMSTDRSPPDFSQPDSPNSDVFGFYPGTNNFPAARKRPLSSISASIVTHHKNGSFHMGLGVAGGMRITTTAIQALVWALDRGLAMKDVLTKPRMHDQLVPNKTLFEYGFDTSVVGFLSSLGHNIEWYTPPMSLGNGIRRLWNGSYDAAGEPRMRNSGAYAN